MIPKVIHCCWLGGGRKDALVRRCRASWERFAHGFEIREWDLAAIERTRVSMPPFVRKALAERKWAFASDWVRFLALEREGGVYFDSDFELLAPIDDLIGEGPFVSGQWMVDGSVGPEPAILALEKGSPVAAAMLEHYAAAEFDDSVTVGEILSRKLRENGGLNVRLMPPEVFSPIDVRGVCHRTQDTRGIHHYAMSWAKAPRKMARWLSWHGMRGLVEVILSIKKKGKRR